MVDVRKPCVESNPTAPKKANLQVQIVSARKQRQELERRHIISRRKKNAWASCNSLKTCKISPRAKLLSAFISMKMRRKAAGANNYDDDTEVTENTYDSDDLWDTVVYGAMDIFDVDNSDEWEYFKQSLYLAKKAHYEFWCISEDD